MKNKITVESIFDEKIGMHHSEKALMAFIFDFV